jgi:Domain of unknown function (DUF4351)
MTRSPFDQFSKQILEEFLSPLGIVNINREVPGEARWIDVWFEPSAQPDIDSATLGLLGRIAATPCLLEAFRQQPPLIDIFSCKQKLFSVFGEWQRQAEREDRKIPDAFGGFPWLWILSPSVSNLLLSRVNMIAADDWPSGVYCDRANYTALIAINQLPEDESTLWIRLLGSGKVQERAIAEILAFDPDDPRRANVLQLLVTWKISLELTSTIAQEEQTVMAQLSQAYLEWEQRTLQRGVEQGLRHERLLILRLLNQRVGVLPEQIVAQIETLPLVQLEALGEALLEFTQVQELADWLTAHNA